MHIKSIVLGAYHYNFETGKELSNIEMLEYLGYTDNDLTLKALQRAVAQHFDTYYGGDDPSPSIRFAPSRPAMMHISRSERMMLPSSTSLPEISYPLAVRIWISGYIPLPPQPMKWIFFT